MEVFISIAGIILLFVIGFLAGVFLGTLATLRMLQTKYPQTWHTLLMERRK